MIEKVPAELLDPCLMVQISYARQLITLEQRNRVINIMNRFRLPLWHVVCHPSLFWKVRPTAPDCQYKNHR